MKRSSEMDECFKAGFLMKSESFGGEGVSETRLQTVKLKLWTGQTEESTQMPAHADSPRLVFWDASW